MTPSLISGWPSLASGAAKIERAGERQLEPAAQALAAHGDQHRDRALDQAQEQRVEALQHRGATAGEMLLDAGAEAEMRPLGVDQHAEKIGAAEMRRRAPRRARRSWRASMTLALGRARRSRSSLPPCSSQTRSGEGAAEVTVRLRPSGSGFPIEILGPGRALGERLAQRDEVDLAMILRPLVEGAEPACAPPPSC